MSTGPGEPEEGRPARGTAWAVRALNAAKAARAGWCEPGDLQRLCDGQRIPARMWVVHAIHLTAVVLGVAAVASVVRDGVAEPGTALAFGAFIAFGETIRMVLPGDRTTAPLGAAGTLAYAVLAGVDGVPTTHGPMQVVTVVIAGTAVGRLPHMLVGRAPNADMASRRVLVAAGTAALFQPPFNDGTLGDALGHGPAFLGYTAALLALAMLCDAALAAALTSARAGWRYLPYAADELRARCGVGSATAACGVVLPIAVDAVGLWALPVFSVPLLLTQFSFRRYAAVRATYRQTIASLSRATEVAGYTRSGHARRVMLLSVRIGRALGMGERDLLLLEYAALMHDIGQLSLVDPIPDGATALLPSEEQRRIAKLGGEVVRQTGVAAEVAVIVEHQADPYRGPDGARTRGSPLASRIIRVANAYDDLVAEDGSHGGDEDGEAGYTARRRAVERLRAEAPGEYEPRVVEALADLCLRHAEPTRR